MRETLFLSKGEVKDEKKCDGFVSHLEFVGVGED